MSGKHQLARRTFLKGTGAAMALPLLEAMSSRPGLAGATESTAPRRMVFVFFPNGCIQPAWTPEQVGTEFALGESLKSLEKFQSELNIITGLGQDNGKAKGDGAGDHARCAASFLTGAHPFKTSGANIRNGVSVDQVGAEKIGRQTRLPSLEVGIEKGRNAGNCDSGYSCAYSSNVSWKSDTTPMAKDVNPKSVFERLFGRPGGRDVKRDAYRKSILDLVANDAARLQKRLGKTDRRKVDEYFTSVREIELRIDAAAAAADQVPPEFAVPDEIPRDLTQHIRLMYDLLVLALQTDSTRIATFMLGNAGSNRAYTMVDVKEGHHSLSHHQEMEEKTSQIKRIDRYLADHFSYFLEKLQGVAEGEGTLLDNSMVLYGSGLGDGQRHSHTGLPIILAGRGGGTVSTGRHIKYDKHVPLNNLFLSMLDRVGATGIDALGDSTGRLSELSV
jgi:hypothetical protein